MSTKRCLGCYQDLPEGNSEFHEECSRAFFGTSVPPVLDYGSREMEELARQIVVRSITLTGVQPKLSLALEKEPDNPKRSKLTIVGLWGDYILKPPTDEYANLPENEDLTMHMAKFFGIKTAKHTLLRLKSGELAYITKRFDRINGKKLALEDMCQLTETMTADKYRSSMEKIGRHIHKYSSHPGLDALLFFELVLFSFLTGNADMHLKNFSLLTAPVDEIVLTVLSPAYDLVCTKLAIPSDMEEMALTLNAKKSKLKKSDFDAFAANLKIPTRSLERIYEKFAQKTEGALEWIDRSFLPADAKANYRQLLATRLKRLDF